MLGRFEPSYLLDHPPRAVGIAESTEGAVVGSLRIRPGDLNAVLEVEELTDTDTPFHQGRTRRVDVGDDEMKALDRARRFGIPS